ncbi:hypothetical protein GCM10009422_02630 [Brevundimonas kwangchunensis]|uniref:Uncharacterized protein n=1 Tax=Brevundimonas kwangchunensis TaxID=322163 RepID=A0ABN1GH22_9CAUL
MWASRPPIITYRQKSDIGYVGSQAVSPNASGHPIKVKVCAAVEWPYPDVLKLTVHDIHPIGSERD